MEFFLKHQIVIFRTLGSLLLVVSIAAFFWTAPKKGYTENEIAAANVARMEARIASQMGGGTSKREPDASEIAEKFKNTREAQVRYALIIMMISGVGFLGYSFIRGRNQED